MTQLIVYLFVLDNTLLHKHSPVAREISSKVKDKYLGKTNKKFPSYNLILSQSLSYNSWNNFWFVFTARNSHVCVSLCFFHLICKAKKKSQYQLTNKICLLNFLFVSSFLFISIIFFLLLISLKKYII